MHLTKLLSETVCLITDESILLTHRLRIILYIIENRSYHSERVCLNRVQRFLRGISLFSLFLYCYFHIYMQCDAFALQI